MPVTGSNLFENAIGLRVELRKLGIARKRSAADVQTDADPELVRVGADILDSPAYDAIVRADNEIRAWVRSRSVSCPLFSGGAYLVKQTVYVAVRDELRGYLDFKRPALVDAFVEEYEIKAAEGRRRLGSMAREKDYPDVSVVRRAFSGNVHWFGIGAPGAIKGLSDEEYRREAANIRAEFSRSLEAARVALRAEWSELIDRMVDRLQPGADGGRKRFTASLTSSVREFAALFNDRDLTDDATMRELIALADRTLAGVDVEQLREDPDLRKRTREAFEGIKAQVDTMIKPAGRVYGDE